ncbi:hypothetical protein PC129_g16174 [Phytophthora cactorum]|uniref:Uncharacterized protein n=1 Tax=Phytophthora cactorum TaxID=29920 RepID=A0A8T1C4M0_9STRA|nr:hypothetical protein PC111_g15802 [Phytophthora cactorum]KAG2850344.1 hypothetical protein PC113_g16869 [Phytophthora cactorum]KAG2888534.1 hypothetical protein PC114_g18382 [Phytophthora cactorum]KAG2915745.1 hypothetical protein PC117_g17921 [Phytophthora cactorum]KAG2970756.1 hypothetical protein PC118_g16680 [Phytophthora cactorum]
MTATNKALAYVFNSSELQAKATRKDLEETEGDKEKLTREEKLINHQNRIIGELIATNRALTDRVSLLEQAGGVGQADVSSTLPANTTQTREVYSASSTKSMTGGSKALPKGTAAISFDWYAKTQDAVMSTYCNEGHRVGQEAEASLLKFFQVQGTKRKSGSSVLKKLRKYYHEGKLNDLIEAYRARVATEGTVDPAPRETQDLFTRK